MVDEHSSTDVVITMHRSSSVNYDEKYNDDTPQAIDQVIDRAKHTLQRFDQNERDIQHKLQNLVSDINRAENGNSVSDERAFHLKCAIDVEVDKRSAGVNDCIGELQKDLNEVCTQCCCCCCCSILCFLTCMIHGTDKCTVPTR